LAKVIDEIQDFIDDCFDKVEGAYVIFWLSMLLVEVKVFVV